MYWSNASKLAEDLQEGRVDETERFKYYLATFAALSVGVPVLFYSVEPLRIDDLIYLFVSAIVGVIGIILCYRANTSGDNIDFLPRMICLSWTVICKFSIMAVILLVVYSLSAAPHGPSSFLPYVSDVPQRIVETWSWWGSFSSMPILVMVYYGFLYLYLVRVAQATEGRFLVAMVMTDLSVGKTALGLLMFPGSLALFAVTESYIAKHEGPEVIARLAALSVAGLWLMLIGWSFALLHKRSMIRG